MKLSLKMSSWALLLMGMPGLVLSQEPTKRFPVPEPKYKVRVERSEMVPMRDGVKLSTDLFFPEGVKGKLPVVLIRTPYNKKGFRREESAAFFFAKQGYIVAVQDTRGRFESEGDFTISTPDVEDGYDSTQWAATQSWSTGKVGTYGCSYLGDVQVMQAKARNPHLAVMIPQAAFSCLPHRGFGVLNGGAIELVNGVEWFRSTGTKMFLRPPPGAPDDFYSRMGEYFNPAPTNLPKIDSHELWRSLPLIDMLKKVGGPPTDYEQVVSHPPGDSWWRDLGYLVDTDRFDVPALHVSSWYDYGPADSFYQFNLMRRNAVSARGRDNQFIIVSPTTHCGSEKATNETVVGKLNLGDARLDYWNIYLRWFDYWLKGNQNGITEMPKVQIYVMGRNEWRGENEWPLARTQFTKFYLHSDGRANSRLGDGTLNTTEPGEEPTDQFVYDPANPVPSVGGPLCCTTTPDAPAGAFDQSDVEMRHDVLVYTGPPLEEGIEITGPIELVLYASSSARDTDFTGKLVDVHPDGKAYNIQEGILRARYREGWGKKVWMKEKQVHQVRFTLQATSNYFKRGHRIRLEVSSSNFPRFDRNLNTGGNNYDETEWVRAENTIHHSRRYASHILLPVIP